VRFGFVDGNFLRRSMSIFAADPIVMVPAFSATNPAADADTNRAANRF
jgi:hypothetical protein